MGFRVFLWGLGFIGLGGLSFFFFNWGLGFREQASVASPGWMLQGLRLEG